MINTGMVPMASYCIAQQKHLRTHLLLLLIIIHIIIYNDIWPSSVMLQTVQTVKMS